MLRGYKKTNSIQNLAYRKTQHADSVKYKNLKNGLAKHLQIYHADKVGDINNFSFKAVKCFSKNIDRLAYEGVQIQSSKADIVMNSKSEFLQPAVPRIVVTNEVQERRQHGS